MSTLPSSGKTETTYDIVWPRRPVLDVMLAPKTVALIGATETPRSVGRALMENLKNESFQGDVYPVNPKRACVLDVPSYPSIGKVPRPVDLAIICTPAVTVPGVVTECIEAGVKGAIIVSAGFKEIGGQGAELEQKILKYSREAGMRIIGPNCLGAMIPRIGLNATFAQPLARPGSVGFISQSGALCAAVLDWSLNHDVGFSAFISIGSMLDVGWGDLIYHLGDDSNTRSIVIYMETIGDARSFLSAAREVSLTKPIIVLKVGRTAAASKAAASHTGSLTGSDEVLEAAFRRAGVLRVNAIADLFNMAQVLGKQPRPRGPRLSIVTNAGGPAALSTDALIIEGGQIAQLSKDTLDAFDQLLPPFWSHNNPIDILGDADAKRYAKAVEIAARAPENDGVLVILTPQSMTQSIETAEMLVKLPPVPDKPILASWMGGNQVSAGAEILSRGKIPAYPYPDTAARAFAAMWRYNSNLKLLYETPWPTMESVGYKANKPYVREIIEKARQAKRTILTEFESKQILAAYGIPTTVTGVAQSEDEAVELAGRLDVSVVLKLYSETITHKTDVGGVKLNLRGEEAVRKAWREIEDAVAKKCSRTDFLGVTVQPMIKLDGYELILGSSIDPQFGPVLLFGTGGQLVEVFKDRALGLPPLNVTLARRMMEQTRIYSALKGVRGRKPVDLAELEELLVRFSYLVAEQKWIKEIDINPLLAGPDHIIALDARIVLHDAATQEKDLPKLAIRPYPEQYVSDWKAADGTAVTIRPIRPEDEPLMVEFHHTLSESTVNQRYMGMLQLKRRIAHERLIRVCFTDYACEIPLVADLKNPDGRHEILGVGRLNRAHGLAEAQFALVISDAWQGKGLGTELLTRLIEVGRQEQLARITGSMLPDNDRMRRMCLDAGFTIVFDELKNEWTAEMTL
ncbi:MAG TPA: bifunctional acetate--CoA ligase family protein/GNAT family N-acetyltransferase [Candidatus Methylacidiphilales bacterium]|nr:bifunctional acetate--CoA ligase family protein/GNAT family N-acetyltransferase [Candidatus Methylacidiphilales bacterium]